MAVSAQDVKKLREITGAGMLDCKKALEEANGDFEEAIATLRKKGIAVAAKREGKTASEGTIASYIHAGDQIGVLVEVNCETDFVARTDDLKNFAKELCMQVAAQQPRWIAPEDVPESALEKEREILREQALSEGKPESIVDKMVEGRMRKFYETYCLLKQPYIRDDSKTIEDLLNDVVAKTGEKIVIRRFTRYQVGAEG
ncbi:MAG: translation elongation factor Ts [Armatimonadetes bacterium]|nr:translation elongation factor Ts [Armatimonadota bacterium]